MADNTLSSMAIQVELPDPQTMQKHLRAVNPHPQYVMVDGLKDTTKIHVSIGDLNGVTIDQNTVLTNMVLAFNGNVWTPTDINTLISVYPASESYSGTVFLATSVDIENNVNGSLATTPRSVYLYCTSNFSPIQHTHSFTSNEITNKPFVTKITNLNDHQNNTIVTPVALLDYSPKNHTHAINNVTNLRTELDNKSNINHTHKFSEVFEDEVQSDEQEEPRNLQTVLDNKADVNHQHDVSSIVDYVTGLYFLNTTDASKLPFDNILDCPPGYMRFPISNSNNPGKQDYVVVEWGYVNIRSTDELVYEAMNVVQYPRMNVVLHTGFTMLNTESSDPNGIDMDVQLKSLIRDTSTSYVTGFQYYLQHMKDPVFGDAKFLWFMIGIDNQMPSYNAKYSLVLERGISELASYNEAIRVNFIRPYGNELSTSTKHIGITIGSRENKAYSVGQFTSVTETSKMGNVSMPGSFIYYLQDVYAGDKAGRNARADWMRLGINRYSYDETIVAKKGGSWTTPTSDEESGYTNYLEIPLNATNYYADKQYLAIPISTTGSSTANKELIIEWGETSSTTAKNAFSQTLNSKVDANKTSSNYTIMFIDFSGRNGTYDDSLNWTGQFVEQTNDGFSYYPQLISQNPHAISFSWVAFSIRDIASNNVVSAGTYDITKKIVRIPLTLKVVNNTQNIISTVNQNLVIQFGKEIDKVVQNDNDSLYELTVYEKLTQVLHTAMTVENTAAVTDRDAETELWFGPASEFRPSGYETTDIPTTKIKYSIYRVRDNGLKGDKASFNWVVIGLTEEVALRGV